MIEFLLDVLSIAIGVFVAAVCQNEFDEWRWNRARRR